jgi:hypothetical protein
LDLVERACVLAYQDHRERLVNDTILSKYKIDLSTYKREGINFGSVECARINTLIEDLIVGVQLIVYGWDNHNVPHMFVVDEPGVAASQDQEPFAAIGSGAIYAKMWLLAAPALPVISQAEMICRLCEAKFVAEQDKGVGLDTVAGVLNQPLDTREGTSERFVSRYAFEESWPGESGQRGNWSFCLPAAKMAAEQERT